MIVACAQDGAFYEEALIRTHGFRLNSERDVRETALYDPVTGEKTDRTERCFDFVGFVFNEKDDMLAVFPKHYQVTDQEADSRKVFACIAKHKQKRPDLYMGEEGNKNYESNFPFSAFFGIYEYFQTYGLYFEDEIMVKPNAGGRISWKETISKSDKYLIGGKLLMFPLYYRKQYHFSNFITECMIFAIDYTISKFGVLLDARETGQEFPEFDYLEERDYVTGVLHQFRQQVFQDHMQRLLDHLIDFFSGLCVGGSYYLKHYAFSSVWEDMVTDYLCRCYKEVDEAHCVVFDKAAPSGLKFEKKAFHTNDAAPEQYISPDHYSADGDVQLIFDAKYYTRVNGMDYKQIAYMFMLKDRKDRKTGLKKYRRTCSALFLPADKRNTKVHFQLASEFGSCPELVITEEYLDIREVIGEYLS